MTRVLGACYLGALFAVAEAASGSPGRIRARMVMLRRLGLYWEFARPFTLIAPALGMLSGGVTALGAHHVPGRRLRAAPPQDPPRHPDGGGPQRRQQRHQPDLRPGHRPGEQAEAADPVGTHEHPRSGLGHARPLPARHGFWRRSSTWQCFALATAAAVLTMVYSVPPLRTKRFGALANFTIAVPRGLLLKVAGWSDGPPVLGDGEPWYIGLIFGAFLLGASTTKDFADMKGDAADGCITLPVRYGPRRAAWMIAPFFVLPFLLIPLGTWQGWLTGHPVFLYPLGCRSWCSGGSTPCRSSCAIRMSWPARRTTPPGATCTR